MIPVTTPIFYKWQLFKVASNKVSTKVKAISFAENGSYFVTAGNRWRADFSDQYFVYFVASLNAFSLFSDTSSSGIWNTHEVQNTRRSSLWWGAQPSWANRGTTTFVTSPAAKETWWVESAITSSSHYCWEGHSIFPGQLFLAVMLLMSYNAPYMTDYMLQGWVCLTIVNPVSYIKINDPSNNEFFQ